MRKLNINKALGVLLVATMSFSTMSHGYAQADQDQSQQIYLTPEEITEIEPFIESTVQANPKDPNGVIAGPDGNDKHFVGLISYVASRCAMNATCASYAARAAGFVANGCLFSLLSDRKICFSRPPRDE